MRHRASQAKDYVLGGGLGPLMVRAFAGSGAIHAIGVLLTFLVGVQLARGLGVEGYGHYAIAMAVVALASIPAELGLPKLVVREVAAASAKQDLPRLYGVIGWSNTACVAMSAAAIAVIVLGSLMIFGSPASPVAAAILWGLPIIPLAGLTRIRAASLQGLHFIVRGQVPFVVVRPLIFCLLLFVVFGSTESPAAATAIALGGVAAAASLMLAHWWLRSRLPKPQPQKFVTEPRKWLSSAIPLAMSDGVRVVQAQMAILLLGALTAAAEVGLFRTAMSTTVMLMAPMTIINLIVSPAIARLHAEGDTARVQQLVTRAAQAQFVGVLVLALPLLVAGEAILGLVFGAEYEASAGPLRLLLVGQIINSAFGPNAPLLNMTHHERRVTRAMVVALILNAATVIALAPLYGNMAAAFAFVVSMATWNLMTWFDARRLMGIDTLLLPISSWRRRP